MRNPTKLILASASPRRRELLAAKGAGFRILATDADETFSPPISGDELVRLLSRRKAEAALEEVTKEQGALPANTLILAADTVVEAPDGEILGKPRDNADTARMLRALSGTKHHVFSGFTLLWADGSYSEAVDSGVVFQALTDAQIADYIASGEPMGKAGSYAIQGLGGNFVARLEGDFTNVVGLPMPALEKAIFTLFGKQLADFTAF